MKKPEEFNDWIKQQIEDNPQLPPEAAWQQISEGLEIEDAWQGISQDLELENLWSTIDSRLQVHQQLQVWERAGACISAALAIVILFLPLYLHLTPEEPLMAQQIEVKGQHTLSDREQVQIHSKPASPYNYPKISQSLQGRNGRQAAQSNHAQKTNLHTNLRSGLAQSLAGRSQRKANMQKTGKTTTALDNSQSGFPIAASSTQNTQALVLNRPQSKEKKPAFITGIDSESLRAVGLIAELNLKQGELGIPLFKKSIVVVEKKEKNTAGKSWRIGLGASGRISWLMNEKTFQGMEKSSLTTPVPSYRKSFSLQAEKGLSPKLSMLADLMLHSETGQQYREYQSGVYGETDTELRYSHLNLIAAYSPNALGFSQKGHTRLLAGLAAGWLHSASLEGPLGKMDISRDYKRGSAAMVLGYEYNIPLLKNIWMGYGLRGHLDLFNIYGNTAEVPTAFSQTRNAFLDFTISFKYDLKNK